MQVRRESQPPYFDTIEELEIACARDLYLDREVIVRPAIAIALGTRGLILTRNASISGCDAGMTLIRIRNVVRIFDWLKERIGE